MISFFVPGIARPAGSKRVFLNRATGRPIVTDQSGENGKAWRSDVRSAASIAMRGQRPLQGPLHAEIIFVMARPKSHYNSKGTLKTPEPFYHTIKPDATKLWRSAEDAITGYVFDDDCTIAIQRVMKIYTNDSFPKPGCMIKVGELELTSAVVPVHEQP